MPRSLRQIKALYEQGTNIMRLFRETESSDGNSLDSILTAYDLQAGSYVRLLQEPEHVKFVDAFTRAIAAILDRYSADSVMEAGVGEATTLANVLQRMQRPPKHALGFDISWSRIAVARNFVKESRAQARLFVGELCDIPVEDNSVDVVFTSHSVEPNRGREKAILKELFRVTRGHLVLLEPSNELGSDATRRHIEEHRYCLDLCRHAAELGFNVIEHRLFEHAKQPHNETALMIIAKDSPGSDRYTGDFLACPICHQALIRHKENYFCSECLIVYPVVADIPCLSKSNGIIATQYLERA